MPYRLEAFSDVGLTQAFVQLVIDEFGRREKPRLERLWTYYRNPLRAVGLGGFGGGDAGNRWYAQAQECGLPARIVGAAGRADGSPPADDRARQRREAVIENDIAWRIQAMVDFMFGKPLTIRSNARDPHTAAAIERVLEHVWDQSGGLALLQDTALLGHIYGHVDLVLKMSDELAARSLAAPHAEPADPDEWLAHLRVDVIEPRRALPVLDPRDYRRTRAYLLTYERLNNKEEDAGALRRLMPRPRSAEPGQRRSTSIMTEIISGRAWHVYEDGKLIWEQRQAATRGQVPIVHIQNIAQPFEYTGMGEVEPLIPLQDELNTRLSDRASRVTMQSFKMYLAKGITGFELARVGPGQIWSTDNEKAAVEAFGGDGHSPSEETHIREIREALDKISGIPPLASGVVQAKIGNLSSANALRITLMAVLAKTARKRVTYGGGISRMCDLILTALNETGIFKTDPRDRAVRLIWPDPLPEDTREVMATAEAKARLGVPKDRLLAELGYAPTNPEIT